MNPDEFQIFKVFGEINLMKFNQFWFGENVATKTGVGTDISRICKTNPEKEIWMNPDEF